MASRRTEDEKTGEGGAGTAGGSAQRLDKWLWFVRAIKTRTQAAALVSDGKVRVNARRVDKPSYTLKPGDVVTLGIRGHIRVLKMVAPGTRRGPPAEAQTLYEEVTHLPPAGPPKPADIPAAHTQSTNSPALREPGQGRPTKRDRRQLDRLRDSEP